MTELEACFTGGQGLVTDAEAAIADIKAGHYIKGAEDFAAVLKEVKPALANCKNMDDDI